jgi:hypothetical protein
MLLAIKLAVASFPASAGNAYKTTSNGFVQQHLTICNAYHGVAPLEILHPNQQITLTNEKPLGYKECQEFVFPLEEGDHLDFKSGGVGVGTFHATKMPKASVSLLLVPRHRDASTRAMAFESHAFANVKSPQIAVVDAYGGNRTSMVNIIEKAEYLEPGMDPLTETLRFNSIVAVAPGKYDIALLSSNSSENPVVTPLHAKDGGKSVVIRVGGSGRAGLALPQELVVFNSAASCWLPMSLCMLVISIVHLVSH